MSRLSRKEMKRDEVIETVGSVIEYSRGHVGALVRSAVALLAVLLLAVGVFLWRQHRIGRANARLAEAMAAMGEDASGREAARELFAELVEAHSGSRAADVARLYLGGFAAADGDAERARELWQGTATGRAGTAIAVQARLNLLELARQQGRHDELIGALRTQLEEGDATLTADQLLYQLGLTLEAAGSPDEARDAFERLVEEHPLSALRGAAQTRASRLGGTGASG